MECESVRACLPEHSICHELFASLRAQAYGIETRSQGDITWRPLSLSGASSHTEGGRLAILKKGCRHITLEPAGSVYRLASQNLLKYQKCNLNYKKVIQNCEMTINLQWSKFSENVIWTNQWAKNEISATRGLQGYCNETERCKINYKW